MNRHRLSPLAITLLSLGVLPPPPPSRPPAPPPAPPPRPDLDRERIEAAREKRRRKLERHVNTPQAKARRAEIEREFEAGTPIQEPPHDVV